MINSSLDDESDDDDKVKHNGDDDDDDACVQTRLSMHDVTVAVYLCMMSL